jgi:hypothetical protein
MRNALKELGFKDIEQNGIAAWSKVYKGFILFIVKVTGKEKYLASVTVGKVEVSIPYYIDDLWVCEFDNVNTTN